MAIPREIVGAFFSGLIGTGLFFLQKIFESKVKQRTVLFRIYQLIRMPSTMHGGSLKEAAIASVSEYRQRWADVATHAYLLTDNELAAEIIIYSEDERRDPKKKEELLEKISNKLNKKLRRLIKENEFGKP